MRIMATSDLHGNLEGLDPKGADVVVLAGDIAPLRGRGPWHVNDQKKWINKRFREWTASYPDIQFVVIPGNHDFYPIAHILFKDREIDWKYEFSPNVHFLGDRGTEINGVKFYGTPWVPIISYSWAFEGEHDTLVNWFAKIPRVYAFELTSIGLHSQRPCRLTRVSLNALTLKVRPRGIDRQTEK